jgi:hypothetical protein
MDPNAALANAREALARVRVEYGRGNYGDAAEAAVELADAFAALDGWMTAKSFSPADWASKGEA